MGKIKKSIWIFIIIIFIILVIGFLYFYNKSKINETNEYECKIAEGEWRPDATTDCGEVDREKCDAFCEKHLACCPNFEAFKKMEESFKNSVNQS